MRLYIAGKIQHREELLELKYLIEEETRHTVGASWLHIEGFTSGNPNYLAEENRREGRLFAEQDLEDLCMADLLVYACHPGLSATVGRAVEFGYALALRKPILVLGTPDSIFSLGLTGAPWDVTHCEDVQHLIEELREW